MFPISHCLMAFKHGYDDDDDYAVGIDGPIWLYDDNNDKDCMGF